MGEDDGGGGGGGGSHYPGAVAHSAPMGRLRFVLLGLLGAAALLAGATLVANWRQAAREQGTDVRWAAPRWLTNILAVLGLANALLAYLAPEAVVVIRPVETQGIVPPSPGDLRLQTVGLGSAWALVSLGAAALAADATMTWRCFVESWRLRGLPQAGQRWRHVLAHVYIWGLFIVPYLLHQVAMQINLRNRAFQGFFLDVDTTGAAFAVSAAMGVLTLVVNTLVRLGATVYFATRWCFYQPEELVADGPGGDCSERGLRRWRAHCLRSAAYITCSLGLYIYFWFALVLYPSAYYITLTTTPFHIALLLVAQLCFQARIPLPWLDDGASQTAGPQQPEEQPGSAAGGAASTDGPVPALGVVPPGRADDMDDTDIDDDDLDGDGQGDGTRR